MASLLKVEQKYFCRRPQALVSFVLSEPLLRWSQWSTASALIDASMEVPLKDRPSEACESQMKVFWSWMPSAPEELPNRWAASCQKGPSVSRASERKSQAD